MRRAFAAAMVVGAAGVGCAALASVAGAQLAVASSISMFRLEGGRWTPASVVCDGTNRDRVLVVSAPARDRRIDLWSLGKPGLAGGSKALTIGRGEPGMSQIYYSLSNALGQSIGWIHALNPGVVEPGATTPAVTSIKVGRQVTNCRFAPQTRVLGATPRRTIQVTATATGGYRYRSYNDDASLAEIEQPWGGRDTHASLTIDGGRLVDQRGARRIYQFDNGGYTYRVFVSVDPTHGGGGVQVSRGGQSLLTEPFGAYTAALQP